MAVSGSPVTVVFLVWDTSANAGKTGDAANLTLRIVRDGVEATPTGTPVEVDAANAPGIYTLALTWTENTGTAMALVGKSSTSGVMVVPTQWHNLDAAVSSRAEPGDEMDLVDAPNATALSAIQSGIGAITVTSGGTNIVDGELEIEVPRGDSYNLVVEAEDDDGDAIDLSCYDDFTFTVKPRSARSDADDDNAAFQIAGTLSGAGNNVLTFEIEPADTELCDLEVWYDCDIEAANTARTLVRTVAVGRYMTTLDVTRGASS